MVPPRLSNCSNRTRRSPTHKNRKKSNTHAIIFLRVTIVVPPETTVPNAIKTPSSPLIRSWIPLSSIVSSRSPTPAAGRIPVRSSIRRTPKPVNAKTLVWDRADHFVCQDFLIFAHVIHPCRTRIILFVYTATGMRCITHKLLARKVANLCRKVGRNKPHFSVASQAKTAPGFGRRWVVVWPASIVCVVSPASTG